MPQKKDACWRCWEGGLRRCHVKQEMFHKMVKKKWHRLCIRGRVLFLDRNELTEGENGRKIFLEESRKRETGKCLGWRSRYRLTLTMEFRCG